MDDYLVNNGKSKGKDGSILAERHYFRFESTWSSPFCINAWRRVKEVKKGKEKGRRERMRDVIGRITDYCRQKNGSGGREEGGREEGGGKEGGRRRGLWQWEFQFGCSDIRGMILGDLTIGLTSRKDVFSLSMERTTGLSNRKLIYSDDDNLSVKRGNETSWEEKEREGMNRRLQMEVIALKKKWMKRTIGMKGGIEEWKTEEQQSINTRTRYQLQYPK